MSVSLTSNRLGALRNQFRRAGDKLTGLIDPQRIAVEDEVHLAAHPVQNWLLGDGVGRYRAIKFLCLFY